RADGRPPGEGLHVCAGDGDANRHVAPPVLHQAEALDRNEGRLFDFADALLGLFELGQVEAQPLGDGIPVQLLARSQLVRALDLPRPLLGIPPRPPVSLLRLAHSLPLRLTRGDRATRRLCFSRPPARAGPCLAVTDGVAVGAWASPALPLRHGCAADGTRHVMPPNRLRCPARAAPSVNPCSSAMRRSRETAA